MQYGYGFWLDGPAVMLDGGDYGVTFRSRYDRSSGAVCTVIANLETRITPLVRKISGLLSAAF